MGINGKNTSAFLNLNSKKLRIRSAFIQAYLEKNFEKLLTTLIEKYIMKFN
ncbi:hypothetical protein ACUXCC_003966 [Cytobacillus horneckiae]